MYPIWKDGDARYKDSWKGGKVTFNVGNDSPTLTAAKVTFTIDLEFPHTQKVQPDGDVVWAEDCMINGTKYGESEPVYPGQSSDLEAVFPDGTPFKKDKKPAYVFVWKTWGQYWQVADGASSSLTIDTDDIPLGSYTVDIVIYHYRSKEKFIPLGYASTQFSITVNDIVAGDLRFIQNRAIAFTITLHDPSQYLSSADTTFNWDFGDESGALISRELTVTHTYITSGSFKPQVVIQAAAGLTLSLVPSDTEEDNTEDEASSTSNTQDAPSVAKTSSSRPVTLTGRATVVVLAKREADDKPDDCVIYRYGSFCTGIEVFEAIEKVEIVQMDNSVMATHNMERNVLDITVTCQGSLPKEVCSVILDADCLKPIHTKCNMVEPSKECQLVLRHFFNDSGVYCINVSMANDVSLAVTSAKVNIDIGTIAMLLGFLAYRPLKEDLIVSSGPQVDRGHVGSGSSMFWKLLNRRGTVDDCPLLQDRPV
ncbi:hypothetical protein F7725_001115 [Dissostichus mawsoni]|uniref:PKD domain-containing protein n=1 Tax=Dissostichus mawsoni TaxID=36200 RepID=A0A7J5ZGT4_DISMA|nr:hypothetical protein F7725_001115 [Dissostichus mawsoni]